MHFRETLTVLRTYLRDRRIPIVFALAVCSIATLSDLRVVRAMQDEHVVAPQAGREMGAIGKTTYVGAARCLSCHVSLAQQQSTGMGMAAIDPRGPLPLDYRSMIFHDAGYTVTIEKGQTGLQMTASDGSNSRSAPIRWIFGQGHTGQTFILEMDGKFYESRASYYTELKNLDLTIGHSPKAPSSPLSALGRPLPPSEVSKCFSCHTSEDVFAGKLNVEQAHPGVTCESCHGPGSEHVAAMGESHADSATQTAKIFNPDTLAPADLNDFCGSCHRTTRDVLSSGIRDIRNVRFQPYRLENSRCYDPSDPRITCIACHDPHRNLETSARAYDEKCLACHTKSGTASTHAKAAACPRGVKDCVTCHMPKLNLPGAHFAFTDHYIRVVKPNAPYPD